MRVELFLEEFAPLIESVMWVACTCMIEPLESELNQQVEYDMDEQGAFLHIYSMQHSSRDNAEMYSCCIGRLFALVLDAI